MSTTDCLTLIVQVKNLPHLIERWLTWATEQKVQLPVLIADGSEGAEVRRLVEGPRFRELRLSYFTRGPDSNRTEFYQKTVSALEKCSTRYCAILADDDLPDFSSLLELSHMLEDPENVCVRGWVHNFTLTRCVSGNMHPLIQVLSPDPSLDSPDLTDRIRKHFLSYNLNYHDIFRVKDLLAIKRKLLKSCVGDPFLGELLTSVLAVIQGKVIRQPVPFLYRASRRASNDQRFLREHDNWDRMFLEHWMREYHHCLSLWSEASCQALDKATLHRLFRAYYAPSILNCLRNDLIADLGQEKKILMPKNNPPRAPVWAKVFLEILRPFEKTARSLREMKQQAATSHREKETQFPADSSRERVLDFLRRYHTGMSETENEKFM